MTLLSLPPELLARIIFFTIPGDFESIMMACKPLYKAGETYLEKHNRLSQRYRLFEFDADIPSSWELLTVIAQEPIIAEYITTAYLYRDGNWGYQDDNGEWVNEQIPPPSDTSQQHLIKALLQSSDYPVTANIDENEWLERMINGVSWKTEQRLLYSSVFLLTLLPNTLALAPPRIWSENSYDTSSPFVDLLCSVARAANTSGGRSLTKLTHLYPNGLNHGYESRMGLNQLSPLLTLPSLRTLTAVSCIASDDGYTGIPFFWSAPDLSSHVDTLELYACVMHGSELETFFNNFVNLREFRYSHEGKWHGCGHEWDVAEFFDALKKCVGHSLKKLSITITNSYSGFPSRVTSLQDFTQLEDLEIDVRVFAIPKDNKNANQPIISEDIPRLVDILAPTIRTIDIISGVTQSETAILTRLFTGFQKAASDKCLDLQTMTLIRGTNQVGRSRCKPDQDAASWAEVERLIESQGYEYREVDEVRAAWIDGLFQRFPYLDETWD